jgi:NADH dehydrogenase (ubiquinone) 1 beta subcomplex subunit 7
MHAARIDMVYRDFCADLLIPLNECRRKSLFVPWKCEHERHAYELCQYKELKRRMAMAAAGEAGSSATA